MRIMEKKYTIVTGRFETGTEEQRAAYSALFGEENTAQRFELYFHRYNIIHELGHCLLDREGIRMSPVAEEMFVNEFAVTYRRTVGDHEMLTELEKLLQESLSRIPCPVPEGRDFTGYFESIWGSRELQSVAVYGYFQLRSVLEALKCRRSIEEILAEAGIKVRAGEGSSESAEKIADVYDGAPGEDLSEGCEDDAGKAPKYPSNHASVNMHAELNRALAYLECLGLGRLEAALEIVDDPTVQCVRVS